MNEGKEGVTPLFVVHSIEGAVISLQTVMSQVEGPVYGLQCTKQVPVVSVEEVAKYYLQEMLKINPDGPYRVAGYSFGGCIAYEIVTQLEKMGKVVESLVFLDGSHSYVAAHTEKYKRKFSEEGTASAHAQTEALCAFSFMFMRIDYAKLTSELLAKRDSESRVSHVVDILMETQQFSDRHDLEDAAKSFYDKLIIADKYKPEDKVTSKVTLIKAASGRKQGL